MRSPVHIPDVMLLSMRMCGPVHVPVAHMRIGSLLYCAASTIMDSRRAHIQCQQERVQWARARQTVQQCDHTQWLDKER